MELSTKLAGLAKRLPAAAIGGEFELLVRSIGEAKSKSEEDAIVQRMIDLSKRQIKEGLPRKGDNTKALKDLLVYLVYINMLGHDTGWAAAAVIQLCSSKSLVVKKTAYLTTSLLIDPSSDLTIMVTATIQADLKSDNFLIVCTALHTIAQSASPDVVNVFLPQIVSLLRHDQDQVKKKALLALRRLVQVDPGVVPDIECHFIEKLGYKEPSVMVAALCGLHQLMSIDAKPYTKLVHYFTNILKQAAEGKLGRSWDYHRAPAPFVQMALLRLLSMLGSVDRQAAADMKTVVLDVWRRAETLASGISNALVYECMRAVTTIHGFDDLLSMAFNTVPRFLAAKENNLKYAGIDILSRLVDGDSARLQQHQVAIVECLRSPDVSLKRKTLDLLFKMASPDNIEVVAEEVLAYLKDSGDDEAPRKRASEQLATAAEQLAPSATWFVDTMITLLEGAGDVAPTCAADSVLRVLREEGLSVESSLSNGAFDDGALLRRKAALRALGVLDSPKLPSLLLTMVCWILGEYGLSTGVSFETIVEKIVLIPETQSTDDAVSSAVAVALGKLGMRSGLPLSSEASSLMEALAGSSSLEVQQAASESIALLGASAETQRAVLRRNVVAAREPPSMMMMMTMDDDRDDVGDVQNTLSHMGLLAPGTIRDDTIGTDLEVAGDEQVDSGLSFLSGYVQRAAEQGAPPYISLEDRIAMGMTRAGMSGRGGGGAFSDHLWVDGAAASHHHHGGLRFEAYEATPAPLTSVVVSSSPSPVTSHTAAAVAAAPPQLLGSLFDDLDVSATSMRQSQQQVQTSHAVPQQQQQQQQQQQPSLNVNKLGGRKWGPSVHTTPSIPSPQPPSSSFSSSSSQQQQQHAYQPSTTTPNAKMQEKQPSQPALSPEQQRLAASLFGGSGGGSTSKPRGRAQRGGGLVSASPVVPEVDLLGDSFAGLDHDSGNHGTASGGGGQSMSHDRIVVVGQQERSAASMLDDLLGGDLVENGGGNAGYNAMQTNDQVVASLGGLDMLGGGEGMSERVGYGTGAPQQQKSGAKQGLPSSSQDPFAGLL